MSGPHVIVVEDAKAVALASADLVIAAATQSVAARGIFHWCATGGSTPAALYAAMRDSRLSSQMPWSKTHIWFGDERHVDRADPLSNASLVDELLLLPTAAKTSADSFGVQVHAWPTQLPGPAAVNSYLNELVEFQVPLNAEGFPIFDIVMIGVGSDGHCLSVFPGSSLAREGAPVASPVEAPTHIEPHVSRLTFSIGILASARSVCVSVVGSGKLNALTSIMETSSTITDFPAKAALTDTSTWLVDQAASDGLR